MNLEILLMTCLLIINFTWLINFKVLMTHIYEVFIIGENLMVKKCKMLA